MGFTIGGPPFWEVGGGESEFCVGDCEVLVAFSEPSRIETKKFKSYHTNNLTLLLLCSSVTGCFVVDSEFSLVYLRETFYKAEYFVKYVCGRNVTLCCRRMIRNRIIYK